VKILRHKALLWTSVWLAGASVSPIARAQESDAAVFKDDNRSLTLLSRVDDPTEKQAFMAVYECTEPAKRHALAQTFINTYPQSWLLGETYDLAARSSVDLADYDSALKESRFSLRLRPENPILLVLIANIEAQKGMLREAQTHARDTLEYLDQFARPGEMSDEQWNTTKPQLKGSAYFALGRAYMVAALRDSNSQDEFTRALDALNHAVAWNPKDSEAYYLRGLVKLRLGQTVQAASDFAAVTRTSAPLSNQALGQLRQIYEKQPRRPGETFDTFLSRLSKPDVESRLRNSREEAGPPASIRAGYAGSQACEGCHRREYETWKQTGMARMLQEFKPENIIGDFTSGREYKDGKTGAVIRMGARGSRPYFEIEAPGERPRRFSVDYTIGSKFQQGYAIRSDRGLYVLPIEYNALEKAWINYWEMIDPPGSKRAIIADFPKLSSATNYQENCGVCHTSQLRAAVDAADPIDHATFREPGINCEMCHGPSARHAEQMKKGHAMDESPNATPVSFRKIGNREGVQICAQCHRQSSFRQMGAHQEMNYSTEGSTFIAKSMARPYDAFSARALYKDGRFRETTFIVEAFTRSACYRKGTAQCATCHAPHLPNFRSNLTSLKFKDKPDEMCLQCHEPLRGLIAEHTHHPAASEASRCVSCHMPKIVNALLFQARSHQVEIPRADLTERFGQSESPNACLMCHADKDARWAAQKLGQWRS
jgi:predicted CXXCH cytochrome family protein